MSHLPDCLENIIGLSRSTCECFDDGRPFDANESKSGRFIDEIEGLSLNLLDAAADCEKGSIWDILARARDNAILSFKTELMARLFSIYKYRRVPFSGLMGQGDFKNSITPTTTYAGVQIQMVNTIGGIMTLKRIGLIFDQTADFPIYIYDNLTDSPIATYNVHANANVLTWFDLPSPLNLEMNNYGSENPRYWIVYPTGAYHPKDNRSSCGCGGTHYKYYWNTESPRYISYEKYRWSEFAMFTGTTGNDITKEGRRTWATSQYLQGIILDVEFKCLVKDLICVDSIDFDTNEIAATMAAAIQYKASSFVVDSIFGSGNINRFTLTNSETLMGKKSSYIKNYLDRLEWIAQTINIEANDCLICNDFDDLRKIGIFS